MIKHEDFTPELVKALAPEDETPVDPIGDALPAECMAVIFNTKTYKWELYLPHGEELPYMVAALVACATRLQDDPAFVQVQLMWLEAQEVSDTQWRAAT